MGTDCAEKAVSKHCKKASEWAYRERAKNKCCNINGTEQAVDLLQWDQRGGDRQCCNGGCGHTRCIAMLSSLGAMQSF